MYIQRICLLLFFIVQGGFAQPVLSWKASIGNNYSDQTVCSTVDNAGSIFCWGYFSGTIDLDPGTGVYNVTSTFEKTPFCCKLNSAGNFLFGKKLSSKIIQIKDAATDRQGNVFFCGSFDSITDFNPDAGVDFLDAANGNLFVSKWNNQGQYLWTRQFGNQNDTSSANTLCVNDSGEVIIAGYFSGEADFDPGPSFSVLISEGKTDVFFVSLNSFGYFKFCRQIGGQQNEQANDIFCDDKNQIYITGKFLDTLQFFSLNTPFSLTAVDSSEDVFIAKYKKEVVLEWAVSLGGNENDEGLSIVADRCGNVFATGVFMDTALIYAVDQQQYLLADSLTDAFLVKLNTTGNLTWVKALGGKGNDAGKNLSINSVGDVFVAGMFEGELKEEPFLTPLNLFSLGLSDIFVLKYSSKGELLCAGTIGGSGPDTLAGFSINKKDEMYFSGTYIQTADMDLSPDTSWLFSSGATDIFLSKSFPGTCCVSVAAPQNLEALPEIICQGQSSTLTIFPDEKGTCPNWRWYENVCGGMPVGTGDTLSVTPFFTTSYFVRQEGPCDTSACVQVTINVKSSPIAQMEVSVDGECKGVLFSIKNNSINAQNYIWQFSNGNISVQENPPAQFFNFYSSASLQLVAINNNGCTDTAYYFNQLQGFDNYFSILIPNIFSPNDDQINDEFFISYFGIVSDCFRIEIFDRWGVSVFSSTDPDFRWNGKLPNGNLATQGTYFYVVQVAEKKFCGFILLSE
jgi:gliding motility-associated-like protein